MQKGLKLVAGPLYTITLSERLHIVSATLNQDGVRGKQPKGVQLWIRKGSHDHLFAVTDKLIPYIQIGLQFDAGEILGFYIVGKGEVYLSGFSGDGSNKDTNLPLVTTVRAEESDVTNGNATKVTDDNLLATNRMTTRAKNAAAATGLENDNNRDSKVKEKCADEQPKILAKIGDEVFVQYECSLQPSNKILMSNKNGDPLKFVLGDEKICRGMNAAIVGMTVGAHQRVITSPDEAYGAKGLPPVIPPNATLAFDITLIDLKTCVSVNES